MTEWTHVEPTQNTSCEYPDYCTEDHGSRLGYLSADHCATCAQPMEMVDPQQVIENGGHRLTPKGVMLCVLDGTHDDGYRHAMQALRAAVATVDRFDSDTQRVIRSVSHTVR